MKNLELKDICSYLPYGLKCKYSDEDTIWTIDPLAGETNHDGSILQIFHLTESDGSCQPYLRPMSDLTKEITHKGETFVPIVELGKLCGYDKLEKYEEDAIITYGWRDCNGDDYSGYTFSWYEKDRCFAIWGEEIEGEPYYLTNTVLSVYDKLSEWMFDFHGLIDADLALPVTEEFNPYKL